MPGKDPAWESINPTWLRRRYRIDKAPLSEILAEAKKKDPRITRNVLRYALVFHDIPPRIGYLRPPDPDWLRKRFQRDRASLQQIGRELGVGVKTVGRLLEELGIPTRSGKPRAPRRDRPAPPPTRFQASTLDAAVICARYVDGETIRAIAADLGVAFGTVQKILVAHGIPRRLAKNGRLPDRPLPFQLADAWDRHRRGETFADIARAFRVDEAVVAAALRDAGVLPASLNVERYTHSCGRVTRRLQRAPRIVEVDKLYAEGKSVHAIGDLLAVTCVSVQKYLDSRAAIEQG